MPKAKHPRHGSLQFWPRKRAARIYPRVRNQAVPEEQVLGGFAGYKAGMTHVMAVDNRPNSMMKGEVISVPVTVIECPPIKVFSIRLYSDSANGLKLYKEIMADFEGKDTKNISRKLVLPKKKAAEKVVEGVDKGANEASAPRVDKGVSEANALIADVRVNVGTQPWLTGIGKRKPEVFEIVVGGKSVGERLAFAKQLLGKEVAVKEVLKEGQQVDVFAVTQGMGFQGPVKRFGIGLRQHKSEKTKRGPGSLGPWTGPRMWTVAHAGQMGFHNRLERNKWLVKISDRPDEFRMSGGIVHYGNLKSHFIMVKGSVQGPAKRIVRLMPARKPSSRLPAQAPTMEYVSMVSKQQR